MQTTIYKEDKGLNFGKWNDYISKLMYYTTTNEILNKISIPKKVADYGGANGNLKTFIPHAITIDIDESKKPDVLDNIITHSKKYDLVVIRFVLHYLNDYEVLELFRNIKSKNILVIQFENNDLKSKYFNSQNEGIKYFRTSKQLQKLLPKNSKKIYQKKYVLDKDFYLNRLGKGLYKKHKEQITAYHLCK
tara:strand:+ start:796 stop:1368 length:573 start_codon:yes stop_codon:yes gene_type:complete